MRQTQPEDGLQPLEWDCWLVGIEAMVLSHTDIG